MNNKDAKELLDQVQAELDKARANLSKADKALKIATVFFFVYAALVMGVVILQFAGRI